jgi:hypothetical protein
MTFDDLAAIDDAFCNVDCSPLRCDLFIAELEALLSNYSSAKTAVIPEHAMAKLKQIGTELQAELEKAALRMREVNALIEHGRPRNDAAAPALV